MVCLPIGMQALKQHRCHLVHPPHYIFAEKTVATQLSNISKVKDHMSGKPSLEISHVTSTLALLLLEHLVFPQEMAHSNLFDSSNYSPV